MLPAQRGRSPRPRSQPLDRLNAAGEQEAQAALLRCCGSRRWALRLAAHRPYPDVETLLAAADEASYDLSFADLAEAMAAETRAAQDAAEDDPAHQRPPIGGPGASAALTALQAAQATYESTFGHAFIICQDEVPPGERLGAMLAALRARMYASREEERATTADELRRLARGRLLRLVVRDVTVGSPSVPD